MIKFEKKLLLTKVEQRVAKKSGSVYFMLNVLSDGETVACMYKGSEPLDFTKLQSMKEYVFGFELRTGQYKDLTIVSVTDK